MSEEGHLSPSDQLGVAPNFAPILDILDAGGDF
jgi:hypothetical protein